MFMKVKLGILVVALVFALSISEMANSEARWVERVFDGYEPTFAWEETNVYASPDENSEILAQIGDMTPATPDNWNVHIIGARMLADRHGNINRSVVAYQKPGRGMDQGRAGRHLGVLFPRGSASYGS